jgi:hypothetical protein
MQARSFFKVLVEARSDLLHVLHIDRVEKAVYSFIVASDIVHLEAKCLRINIFDLKVAIIIRKAFRVEV